MHSDRGSKRRDTPRTAILVACMLTLLPATVAAQAVDAESLDKQCRYGVSLALEGDLDAAEQAFLGLLSSSPGDVRAYVNLGNIHLLRDRVESALAFYDKAARVDSLDAGIRLNRSAALLLHGDDDAARSEAAAGIEMAGGTEAAADLLGMTLAAPAQESKAAERTHVMKDEIRALLVEAGLSDSTAVKTSVSPQPSDAAASEPKKRLRVWYASSLRAGDSSEFASALYWRLDAIR